MGPAKPLWPPSITWLCRCRAEWTMDTIACRVCGGERPPSPPDFVAGGTAFRQHWSFKSGATAAEQAEGLAEVDMASAAWTEED